MGSIVDGPSATFDSEPERTQLLVEMVATTLAIPDLDADSNFIEEGGHSLLAVAIAERLIQAHGLHLDLEVLYRCTFREAAASMTTGVAATSPSRF